MTDPPIRRRTLLASASAVIPLAGCAGDDGESPTATEGDDTSPTGSPTDTGSPTPSPDPDTATATETATEELNFPPRCEIESPADLAVVEDSVTVEILAFDGEDDDDELTVEVAVDDGDWEDASYDADADRYVFELAPDGEAGTGLTIYARATDSNGAEASADPITLYLAPAERRTATGDFSPGIRHSLYDGPIGGGEGLPASAINAPEDADTVVSDGDLQAAIDASSRGDVIYVEGSATVDEVHQDEITIAGNRGAGDDGHIDGPQITGRNVRFDGLVVEVDSSIQIAERGWECFNCEFSGAGHFWLRTLGGFEPDVEFRQCEIHDFEEYKTVQGGYLDGDHLSACGDSWYMPSYQARIRIVYCEWYNTSKIAGTQFYFEAVDNHFRGTGSAGTILELRAPNECRVTGSGSVNDCGSPCGTAILEHNLNEMESGEQGGTRLVQVRGTPWRDPVAVRYNEAPVNSSWDAGCEANDTFDHAIFDDQILLQNAGAAGADVLDNIVVEHNDLA